MSGVRHSAIRATIILVTLILPAALWGQSTLNFPRAASPDELGLTGIAIVNPGPVNAQVTYQLYGAGGQVVATSSHTIPAGGQLAKLGLGSTEIFQQVSSGGWIQATSATTGLQGFWLGGDFTTFTDGAAAATPAADLVFPLVSGQTEINVANPGVSSITITLRLYGADGVQIGSPAIQSLAGHGSLQRQVSSLFPGADPAQSAHIRASCTGQCAGAAVLSNYIVSPSLGTINAVSGASVGTEAYFPQIVSGVGGGGSYTTIAGVVNLTPVSQIITLTFTPASGSPQAVMRTLPGNGAIRDSVQNLFGFSAGSFREGWVKVVGSAPLTAFTAYGDTARGGLAIVPVQDTPRSAMLFAHIADLPPWLMGLALLNIGATDAIVEVYAMTPSGTLIGGADNVPTARFTLSPGSRRAALLSELIPQTQQRTNDGGFVLVRSSAPLYGMGLFFTRDLAILANLASSENFFSGGVVAPTVIDSYTEANYEQTVSLNDIRTAIGQVFVPAVSAYLRSSKFYLSRENNPAGTMVARLYAVTGTPGETAVPTGSPLATSAAVSVSTLTSFPTMGLVTFEFMASPYLMSAGVPYAIVVEYAGGSSTNTIPMAKNNAGTHPGNKTDWESGAWIGNLGLDTIFYVYGNVTP